MTSHWLSLLLAFGVSAALTWLLVRTGGVIALDIPNERSLHSRPVPRLGGLALVVGVVVGWSMSDAGVGLALWIALALLVAISLGDDLVGAPVLLRLSLHLAAAIVVLAHRNAEFGLIALVAMVLAVVWMTNLYNFMDGADGLAGGMAVLGFTGYGLAAWAAGDGLLAVQCASIAAAAAGFLLFNFNPARIFLGDAGSIPLGFLSAVLGIQGWQAGAWPFWFPLLVFSPFLVDATVTLLRRALLRRRVWDAHRDHYYQRLVRMGWSHRRLALCEYVLITGAGFSALLLRDLQVASQLTGLVGWSLIYFVLMVAIDRRWTHFLTLIEAPANRQ